MKQQQKIVGNKKLLIFGFLISLSILSLPFVFSALTLNTPASSSTISGTAKLNVTSAIAGPFNESNFTCKFYAKSIALTENTSWILLATVGNNTAGQGGPNWVNATFDSRILSDGSDYTFNATCNNISSTQQVSLTTGVNIDNTIPQAPTSLSPTTEQSSSSVDFSASVVGVNTTACTLYFIDRNPGSSSYAMTHSGNTCTHTISTVPDENYQFYVQASDGTNTTNSATTTFDVQTTKGNGGTPTTQTTNFQAGGVDTGISKYLVIGLIGFLVLIVITIVIVIVVQKKK